MKIVVLPGDGIGPEITDATLTVLQKADAKYGLGLDLQTHEIGLKTHSETGTTIPDNVLDACRDADATILGPTDTLVYPKPEDGGRNPSATFRKGFDLYANIRPCRTYENVPSMASSMDLVIVRENTEGFYADRNMFQGSGEFMPTEDLALSVRKITRQGCRRIALQALKFASRRRKKLTIIHKANVLKVSDGLFLGEVRAAAEDFPDVELEDLIIDAAAAHLIRRPADFDVVVATNMYGDILSDQAAELSGGLGLGGSINASDTHAFAQAAHGAAPDIAGQQCANPAALMISVAMLLDWLGDKNNSNSFKEAAASIQGAVGSSLGDVSVRTPDLGGPGTTKSFGESVASKL